MTSRHRRLWHCALGLTLLLGTGAAAVDYATEGARMVELIREDVRLTRRQLDLEQLGPRVLEAMVNVPRHQFVPPGQRPWAYDNRPLPIGHGQTISQPYIVAIMTELLELQPGDKVFELGTGSGYQAAVLAELGCRVYSMEIIPALGEQAAATLARLGYEAVTVRVGDGYHGWPDQGPFDGIVVTAAGDHIPPPLVAQLKPGGRMIMPVGSGFLTQQLILVEKGEDGAVTTRGILPVRFVPLTGGH